MPYPTSCRRAALNPKISEAEPKDATVSALACARRRLAAFCRTLRGNERDRAADLLDRLGGAAAGVVDGDRDLRRQHPLAEQPHPVARLAGETRREQRRRIDRLAGIEPPGIDRRLQAPQIDLVEAERVRLNETALGQPAINRHLPALETRLGTAGPGRLALAPAPCRLAEAGADAAADPLAHMAGARLVRNAVELPGLDPSCLPAITPLRRCGSDERPWQSCRAPPACPRALRGG